MAYYDALITAWNGTPTPPNGVTGTSLTGLTTANKLIAVNGWTVTGSIPTNFFVTGNQIANCINWTEAAALTAAQRTDVLNLCQIPGQLLGGSGNTAFMTDGMIIAYFPVNVNITSGTYNNGTGVVVLTMASTITFGVGGKINVNTLTGTGAFASLNGNFTTIATTSGTTCTYNAGAGLGTSTITGGKVTPPTINAMTALAQATVQPWWQFAGYPRPFDMGDVTTAGLS